ncbi:threonine/serine exporter family protein [Vagococcus sp. JNUCC 83]
MFIKLFFSFVAGCAIAILYNIEKDYTLLCGLSGMFTWFVYYICTILSFSEAMSSLIALLALIFLSHLLSKWKNVSSLVFNMPGIMPIVPGGLLFKTFNNLTEKHYDVALHYGFQACLVGGAIAIGFIINEAISKILLAAKMKIEQEPFIEKKNNHLDE